MNTNSKQFEIKSDKGYKSYIRNSGGYAYKVVFDSRTGWYVFKLPVDSVSVDDAFQMDWQSNGSWFTITGYVFGDAYTIWMADRIKLTAQKYFKAGRLKQKPAIDWLSLLWLTDFPNAVTIK